MKIRSAAILVLAVLALGACRRKTPAAGPALTGDGSASGMDGARADSLAAERARLERERELRLADAERVRAALTETVYFAYDSEDLTAEAEERLRAKAAILRENPGVQLRIEGHADARGSTEYNLALAQRRAESVRDFLAGYGIAADRVETVSFGKERPAVEGESEDAYALNRRAEFSVTSGIDSLGGSAIR